ncbi:MAG: SDR family NAD(P)-dependent oxidoreductase [Candidatus Nanopelagicaceae bacterium]
MFSLKGKSALVTGAGDASGIGFAAAKALKELGAEVLITSTSDRIYKRAEELGAKGFIADLTNESDVQALESQISSLDILVNNAGMTSVTSPAGPNEATDISQVSLEALQKGMSRNLETTFLATKYFLPKIRKSQSGRIIMISSLTGPVMAMRNQPVYATAKAALIGLTKSIALDEAKYGITCNAILPGWIATDSISESEKSQGLSVPMGRGGRADEIASAIAWLSTLGASYITGQTIIVDGGNSIKEERA